MQEREARSERQRAEPELVDFQVNLAPNSDVLTVNGQQYWHGKTYKVEPALARSLNEMAGATWKHERDIHGTDENQYRRRTMTRLSGRR